MAPPWYLLLLVALVSASKCPEGSICDNEGASRALPMITDVACTNQMGCPEEYSCVRSPLGGSACCPLDQGTPCQDGHHCCPSGTQCSEDGHSCLPASNQSAIICPDGRSECPSGTTCCQMSDQSWGCCPMEQAICCSDHLHCCPHNTQCDLEHSTCVSGDQVFPMSKKLPARVKLQASAKVQCDATTSCPGLTTCCRLASGEWGCCPFSQAVCCPDHVHCCPNGYSCEGGSCVQDHDSIPWMQKIPALKEKSSDVPCDETTYCPDKTTCCRLASGEWGCCPLEQAVCCPDHVHCCPNGYSCQGGSCVQDNDSIPWLRKIPALKEKSTDVQCDDTTYCPDKTTCCRLSSGEWGCCPIEQAVCCTDHLHCCPRGYTCDVSTGTCNKPVQEPVALEPISPVTPVGYVWCDGTHRCLDGQTCCVGPGGVWACCPYTRGVCCPDRLHCCPYGHVCLNYGAQCSRSGNPRWDLGWIKGKQPAL